MIKKVRIDPLSPSPDQSDNSRAHVALPAAPVDSSRCTGACSSESRSRPWERPPLHLAPRRQWESFSKKISREPIVSTCSNASPQLFQKLHVSGPFRTHPGSRPSPRIREARFARQWTRSVGKSPHKHFCWRSYISASRPRLDDIEDIELVKGAGRSFPLRATRQPRHGPLAASDFRYLLPVFRETSNSLAISGIPFPFPSIRKSPSPLPPSEMPLCTSVKTTQMMTQPSGGSIPSCNFSAV